MTRLIRYTLAACATVGATAGIALAAAPAATTQAATSIAATTATLNATVSPNGESTTYSFEYGTTTAYGTKTPAGGPIQGNGDRSVSADVTGLAPSTTYHYRIVATNASGAAPGADMTFTTTAAGAPTGNAITAAASRLTTTFGRSITVSGALTGPDSGGVTVTLEENPAPYNGGFKSTGLTTTTDAAGNYSIVVAPALNTRYRVVAKTKKPTTSAELSVRVRVKVSLRLSDSTPAAGQRVRFSGFVLPGHDGTLARIQRRTATGTWRTVSTTTLVAANPVGATPRSKFSKRVRVNKTGTYRVKVTPTDGNHITGYSGRRTATTH